MSRQSMRPTPSRWETLETTTRRCPACGGRLSCHYTNRRAVVTLDGLVGLRLKVRRCVNRNCARYHRAFRPEAEGALVLAQQEFGLDIIALVGRLRYTTRASRAGDPCRSGPARRGDLGAQRHQPAGPL